MSEDPHFVSGYRQELGSHHFSAAEIVEFAAQFDPQRFHTDADAAKNSVFGALCASGWHTAAVWMKLNVETMQREIREARAEGRSVPEFGPSPGFRNLKWHRPVFAGDEIRFSQTVRGTRPVASRPGWSLLETIAEAHNGSGELVMSFESAALIKLPAAVQTG
jgi:acyl dehydratase